MELKTIGIIVLTIICIGCGTKEKDPFQLNQGDISVARDKVGKTGTPVAINVEDIRTKSVKAIISYIDSLYSITTPATTDSIVDFTTFQTDTVADHRNGLLDYVTDDLRMYYKHLSFHFFVFKDRKSALEHFTMLVSLSNSSGTFDTPQGKKYDNLFSKAGSTYILYGNSIIHHLRRCNYNEGVEKPRENNFVSFLFNAKPPTENYFLRVTCGWANAEIK